MFNLTDLLKKEVKSNPTLDPKCDPDKCHAWGRALEQGKFCKNQTCKNKKDCEEKCDNRYEPDTGLFCQDNLPNNQFCSSKKDDTKACQWCEAHSAPVKEWCFTKKTGCNIPQFCLEKAEGGCQSLGPDDTCNDFFDPDKKTRCISEEGPDRKFPFFCKVSKDARAKDEDCIKGKTFETEIKCKESITNWHRDGSSCPSPDVSEPDSTS